LWILPKVCTSREALRASKEATGNLIEQPVAIKMPDPRETQYLVKCAALSHARVEVPRYLHDAWRHSPWRYKNYVPTVGRYFKHTSALTHLILPVPLAVENDPQSLRRTVPPYYPLITYLPVTKQTQEHW